MITERIEAMKRAKTKEDFAKVVLDAFEDLIPWEERPDYWESNKARVLSDVWAIFGDN